MNTGFKNCLIALSISLLANFAHADPKFDSKKDYAPGISDSEIMIGQTVPYSGPISVFGTIGKSEQAYFDMINEHGGVNGRKLKLISLDDSGLPPKTLEQTRRLVEEQHVAFTFSGVGTPQQTTVRKYLNDQKVPQLFLLAGSIQFNDPQHFPWSLNFIPMFKSESEAHVRYIFKHKPNAKIAILSQNDDFGREYLRTFKEALGDKAADLIVAEASSNMTDPNVDTQVIALQASGADVFFSAISPRATAQSIRKAYDLGWHPLRFIDYPASSKQAVLEPAGLEKAAGVISAGYLKDPGNSTQKHDPAVRDWVAWMQNYYPSGDAKDINNVVGYNAAMLLVRVLEKCGNNLFRENIMRQATVHKRFTAAHVRRWRHDQYRSFQLRCDSARDRKTI
jgi:ABC-type branched-subunit amino acid transport system substrate-binding protein